MWIELLPIPLGALLGIMLLLLPKKYRLIIGLIFCFLLGYLVHYISGEASKYLLVDVILVAGCTAIYIYLHGVIMKRGSH